ncbi:hypothetical protein GJ654_18850 [Rhodoblastus acidophilus]|uniref:Uncharacterized protein n=1 Tax=Rhodoblastus acidophilus TaxID=1074 RepID=A0A6N8DV35_RHOAC|nr:hypothetical protein [Rhodoblastus acidophilus]MCW2276388.1 hypothetical protein [Rhodoblastus acidophilus]MTV33043.1 hypothetical protein [Rhodoblastus acidophilus]
MADYTLTLAQLDKVMAAIPLAMRGPDAGLSFALTHHIASEEKVAAPEAGATVSTVTFEAPTSGILTTTDAVDAVVAPIIAEVLAGRTPPAPPAPVPQSVSRRQFFHAVALAGFLTEAEAEAAVARQALPAAVLAEIGKLPAGDQFGARMLAIGAETFERANPLMNLMAAALGHDAGDVDDLFRFAATL